MGFVVTAEVGCCGRVTDIWTADLAYCCSLLTTVIDNIILESEFYYFWTSPLHHSCLLRWPLLVGHVLVGCQVCMHCARNHPIVFQKQNVTSQYLEKAESPTSGKL